MERILVAWEGFAVTLLPAAANMTSLALRDHAREILEAVALDLEQPQSRVQQHQKSIGKALRAIDAPETAAETHAVLRAKGGFDVNQMVSEYRALRASVLRLWMDDCGEAIPHMDDIVRFNEAIDQAVAESVAFFTRQVEQSRNLLLGMLGHDMRSPLTTIVTTAEYLAALNAGEQISAAASRLVRSGASMQALLDDLVDFNRTKLGLGINILARETDLARVFRDELEQLRGAHPDRDLRLHVEGDTRGRCDGARLKQVLRNLVTNATRYGSHDAPVRVIVTGIGDELRFEVVNRGAAIDEAATGQIFDPLQRGTGQAGAGATPDGGLGLGLYIVREITHAHGGTVSARSSDGETTFVVTLPRRGPP
ncbi:MAG TPA: HAMP domain-containing sensor histidine kinase [Xanthomonadales bacterium]|nr:HAMP domain-containing sensor histidine kinase [Xanthomonadales bacterium]